MSAVPCLMQEGPPAERLLLLMALAQWGPEERSLAQSLLAEAQPQRLAELAAHNRLKPMVHRALMAWEANWGGEALQAEWAADAQAIAQANLGRAAIAMPIFSALAAEGVPVILLKGNRLALELYGSLGYKRMNDVDLLVRFEDLGKTVAAYRAAGCVPLGKLKADDDFQRDFSHHTPPFFDPTLTLALGTHWDLVTPFAGFCFDVAGFWERKRPVAFPDAATHTCFGMAPEDDLHHLLVHLPRYKTGLRELMDPINLLRHHAEAFDWEAFLGRVEAAGTAKRVLPSLMLLQALLPLAGVPEAIARLKPRVAGGGRLKDAQVLASVPARILSRRSTITARVDKAFVRFDSAGRFGPKLLAYGRMWGIGLWPSRADRARLMAWAEDDPRLPFAAPLAFGRVIGHVAEDLGPKVFALLLVKMKVDLAKSAWRTLMGRPKPDALAATATALGLDERALEAAMERLE